MATMRELRWQPHGDPTGTISRLLKPNNFALIHCGLLNWPFPLLPRVREKAALEPSNDQCLPLVGGNEWLNLGILRRRLCCSTAAASVRDKG
jgi:hypothetical protein